MNKFIYLFRYWLPPFLWVGFSYYLSSLSGDDMPKVHFQYIDKLVHFGIYFIMALLFFLAFHSLPAWRIVHAAKATFIFCVVYSGLDEFHQLFSVGRSVELNDWFADVLGSLAGLFCIVFGKLRK